MAKYVRCSSGHVYDSEAHEVCPKCGATRVVSAPAPTDSTPEQQAPPAKSTFGLPLLIGGGAGAAALALGAFLLLGGQKSEPVVSNDTPKTPTAQNAPAASANKPNTASSLKSASQAPDVLACTKAKQNVVAACDRVIASNKYSGKDLATLYYARGEAKADTPEKTGAIEDLTKAISLDPNNYLLFYLRGYVFAQARQYDPAIKDYDRVLQLKPSENIYLNRGFAYLRKGDLDRAIADFDKVPNEPKARFNRALSWTRKGDRDKALADYKAILSIDRDPEGRKEAQAAITRLEDESRAATSAAPKTSQPSAANPPSADAGKDAQNCVKGESVAACDAAIASGQYSGAKLGALYFDRGNAKRLQTTPDLAAAIDDYSKAAELVPGNVRPLANRAGTYLQDRQYDLAIADYDRILKTEQTGTVYMDRGVAWERKGDLDHAMADFDQAVKLSPNEPMTYFNRANVEEHQSKLDVALADYNKGLSLHPRPEFAKAAQLAVDRVEALLQKAPPPAMPSPSAVPAPDKKAAPTANAPAEASLDDAEGCTFLDQSVTACSYWIESGRYHGGALGELYGYRGDSKRQAPKPDIPGAIKDYNQAIDLSPQNFAAVMSRAEIYFDAERFDLAIKDYDRAIQLRPDADGLYTDRGIAYLRKGDFDRAIADFDKGSKDLLTYSNRAVALDRRGDRDRAVADYKKVLLMSEDGAARASAQAAVNRLETEIHAAASAPKKNYPSPDPK